MARNECFGGYDANDKNCVDPEKGPCGASDDCKRAVKFTGGQWFKNLSAQKIAEVEAALANPPVANSGRSRTDDVPAASQAAAGAGSSLENELDAELGGLDKSGAVADASPPPAQEQATPPARRRPGRKSNAQKEIERLEAEKLAAAGDDSEQRSQAALDKQATAAQSKAAPVERVATEVLTVGLQKQFGILFDPLFQQLIPDALAGKVNLVKEEDGSISVLVKGTFNLHPSLREAAAISFAPDGLVVHADDERIVVDESNVSKGIDAIIGSVSKLSKLLDGGKAKNAGSADSPARQRQSNGRKKRADAGKKRGPRKKSSKKKGKKREKAKSKK